MGREVEADNNGFVSNMVWLVCVLWCCCLDLFRNLGFWVGFDVG